MLSYSKQTHRARPGSSLAEWTAFFSLFLTAVMVLAACSPAQQPATTAEALAAPTNTLPPPATATPLPSATPAPSATPMPTATTVPPLALESNGFNAWCLPLDFYNPASSGAAWTMPAGARPLTENLGYTGLQVPALSCTLVFTFNQPMPKGVALEVYQGVQQSPWLTAELQAASDNPNLGYAVLDHSYVINPPFWEVLYRFALRSPDGKELWADEIRIFKALPERCWDNSLPDPVTLECPINDR